MSWHHQMHRLETQHILLNNLESKHSGNEIWPIYIILQRNFFIKKFCEKCGLGISSRPFLIFKESSVNRIWGLPADSDKFDSFAISNTSSLPQKSHFSIEVAPNSFQTQKYLGLVFKSHHCFFVFFCNMPFVICHKLAKFH